MELVDRSGPAPQRRSRPPILLATRQLWVPLLIGAGVLVLDQITKALVRGWIGPAADRHRVDLLGRQVAFVYVENPGAAFGILRGQTAFLILAAGAIVALLLLSLRGANRLSPLMYIGLGLLLGGAIGNLADRIRFGYVTDFIAVAFWPKFNVADSAITVGLILMAWAYLLHESSRDDAAAATRREQDRRDTD